MNIGFGANFGALVEKKFFDMSKDYQSLDDAELKKRYEPENGGITSLIKCIANLRRRLDDGEMNIEKNSR